MATSMTLADLREYVRTQTQTTTAELPNSTVDIYLQEAFDRTIAMENQWPFFEETWALTQTTGSATMTFPSDAHIPGIVSLFCVENSENPYRVELISHSIARELYDADNIGTISYQRFSVWDGLIYLWPNVTKSEDFSWELTGFRRPTDWIDNSSTPDCDNRLHRCLAHYAVALAYAQQEDEQLEDKYMQRWSMDLEAARAAIMEPAQDRPLIMGPHRWRGIGPYNRRMTAIVDANSLP